MKYLFFDIECANCYNNCAKIFSLGYCITDENFNILHDKEDVLIIRGYRRRDVLKLQLLRMTAYHSLFAMRENKSGITPDQLWPLYFDRYKTPDTPPPISDQEVQQLQAEMAAINAAGNPFAQ